MMNAESQRPVTNGPPEDDDTFERDLKEMLEDGPNLSDSSSNVQGGVPTRMSASYTEGTTTPGSGLSQARLTRSYTMPPGLSLSHFVCPLCT